MTACDGRILLANWFFKAFNKAMEGDAKRKCFEHAGALLTADGSDDDKIKLESAPVGYRLDLAAAAAARAARAATAAPAE